MDWLTCILSNELKLFTLLFLFSNCPWSESIFKCVSVILTFPNYCFHTSIPSDTKEILGSYHIFPYIVIELASSLAYFLRSSLLRHNLHTIGFNILNYTVHCVYRFVTSAIFKSFLSPQKFPSTSLLLIFSPPRHLVTTDLLSVTTVLPSIEF